MINIGIIGAGQLGSRHLQALAQLKRPVNIHVVDTSSDSLATAEKRFKEVATAFEGNVNYLNDLESLPPELEIVIVATGSKVRRSVIEKLLSNSTVHYLILEKFLFTKMEDYLAIAGLLESKKVYAFVNCPRRMMSFYKKLREEITGPVHLFATGNEWGLACNGIHLVDLFSFVTGEQDVRLTHHLIDEEELESKRPGYIELTGTITGHAGRNSIHLTSFKGTTSALHLHIHTPSVRYSIQEGANAKVWISRAANNWEWEETGFQMSFQSQLTHLVVESLLSTGTCELTGYAESARLHRHFLANILQYRFSKDPKNTNNEVLIT